MAGQRITFGTDVTLGAGNENDVLQVKAAANVRVKLLSLVVTGMQPAGGSDAPCEARITRTTASFGTFTGTVVKEKVNPSNGETIQTTFSGGADGTGGSTRPTVATDTGIKATASPQSGADLTVVLPKGGLDIPGGQAVNLALKNAAAVRVFVSGECEE